MVHRKKDFDNPPIGLIDSKWNNLRTKLLKEKSKHEVKGECYRDTTIDALTILYKNKCAICERDRGTELQVDHYRPKKPRDFKTEIKYNHPGYYWLAYSWSNLIPLCSKCNNNKSNKFPLLGWTETDRISDHENINGLNPFEPYSLDWLQQKEKPFIINPEHDTQPERHFSFNIKGEIEGRTPEGTETISVCKLNRKDLIRERLKIVKGYSDAIKDAFDDFNVHRDNGELKGELRATFKKIRSNCHPDQGHSYFNLFIYEYYDYFISSKLPDAIQEISTRYFNQYKANVIQRTQ